MVMSNNKKYIKAAAVVCIALTLFACGKSAEERWQEQYDLGQKYLQELDYEQALIAFTNAIELDPNRAEAYIMRADTYYTVAQLSTDQQEKTEYVQKARGDYEYMVSNSGLTPDIFYKLADIYIEEKDEEALEDLVLQAKEIMDRGMLNSWLDDHGYYLNNSDELEVRLTQIGATDDMISLEDINFYGNALTGLDFWSACSILQAQGPIENYQVSDVQNFVCRDYENHEVGVMVGLDDDGTSIDHIDYMFNYYAYEGYHDVTDTMKFPIGIRDINLGDTMAEVLTKFGFSNGNDISARVKEIMTKHMYPEDDEFQYATAALEYWYNNSNSVIDFGCSCNGETGKITSIYLYVDFEVSPTTSYRFDCRFGRDEFEDKLRSVQIWIAHPVIVN